MAIPNNPFNGLFGGNKDKSSNGSVPANQTKSSLPNNPFGGLFSEPTKTGKDVTVAQQIVPPAIEKSAPFTPESTIPIAPAGTPPSIFKKAQDFVVNRIGENLKELDYQTKPIREAVGKAISETPIFGVQTALAPESEQNAIDMQKQFDQSLLGRYNRKEGIAKGSYVSGLTGGIIKPPTEAPISISDKVVAGIANVAGAATSINKISGAFGALAQGDATIASLMGQYPTVAKYAFPLVKNIVGFDIYGQLDPDTKDRFKKLAMDTLMAVPYTGLGFIPKAGYSIPASVGLGYGLAKLDGASDEDALIQGGILGVLDAAGRAGGVGEQFVKGRYTDRVIRNEAVATLNEFASKPITVNSTPEEIKMAYREAAHQTHPDKPTGNQADFVRINEAYKFLTSQNNSFSNIVTEAKVPTENTGSTPAIAPKLLETGAEVIKPNEPAKTEIVPSSDLVNQYKDLNTKINNPDGSGATEENITALAKTEADLKTYADINKENVLTIKQVGSPNDYASINVVPLSDGKFAYEYSANTSNTSLVSDFLTNELANTREEAITQAKKAILDWAKQNADGVTGKAQVELQNIVAEVKKVSPTLGVPVEVRIAEEQQSADIKRLTDEIANYKKTGTTYPGDIQPFHPAIVHFAEVADKPAIKNYTQDQVDEAITNGIIPVNADGTITLYRAGTEIKEGRLVSATYDKAQAEQFVELGKQNGREVPLTEFKVKPEDISIYIGGGEGEVLVHSDTMKPPTQKEKVKQAVGGEAKTAKQIAEETKILEPNVRRILGMGAKDGTFERVDKGVYKVKTPDGQDVAYILPADAVEALPKLAKEGFKADMVFLDIPYDTPAVRGGNRGVNYNLISTEQFKIVMDAVKDIVKNEKSPVFYMYSQAASGEKKMQVYNDILLAAGFKPVAKGELQKLFQSGKPVTNVRGEVSKPEGILMLTQSGEFDKELKNLNFKLVRPKGYQTEKPAEMIRQMIEMSTNEGDVVLDPFAGSGVVPAEAVKAGRKAVAIEKDKEQAAKIAERVKAEAANVKPRFGKKNEKFFTINFGKNGTDFVPVDGKLVEIIPGIETFIYKNDVGNWIVTEAKTGMSIASGAKTQKASIEQAKKVLEEQKDVVGKLVEEQVKKYGISPRYSQAEKAVQETAPAEKAIVSTEQNLPTELAGAKPRYGFGEKLFTLDFKSDVDKALYIVAKEVPSKADAKYMEFLNGVYPELSDTQIRAKGKEVRSVIKELARNAEPGNLVVEKVKQMEPRFGKKRAPSGMASGEGAPIGNYAKAGAEKIGEYQTDEEAKAQGLEPYNNFKLFEKVKELIQKYAKTVGQGYTPRGALGVYYTATKNIRVNGMNDLSVASHEITHFLDKTFGIAKQLLGIKGYAETGNPIYESATAPLRKEMTALYTEFYPGGKETHTAEKRMTEGFATLLQKYVEMPKTITAKYPNLVKEFLQEGGKYYHPVMGEIITDMKKIVAEYQGLSDLDKINSRIISDETAVNKNDWLSFWDKFKTEVADNVYPIEALAKKAGTHLTAGDPSLWLRQYNNVNAVIVNNMKGDKGYWGWRNGDMVKLHDFNWKTLSDQLKDEKTLDDFRAFLVARREHFLFKELDTRKAEIEKAQVKVHETSDTLAELRAKEAAPEEIKSASAKARAALGALDTAKAEHEALRKILENDGFTKAEVDAAYLNNSERFTGEAEMFDTLTGEDLKFLNDPAVQLLTPEEYSQLSKQEGYASFKRQFYDEITGAQEELPPAVRFGKSKVSSLMKRTGSQKPIIDPLYSGIANHSEITKKAMKQIIYNKMLDMSTQFPELFQKLQLQAVPDAQGRILFPQEKDQHIIMARENYKRVPILTDNIVKRTIDETLTSHNIGYFEQLLMGASRFFTKGTTGLFPGFALTNYAIDQVSATALTRNNYIPLYDPLKELYNAVSNKEGVDYKYFQEYLIMGAERQTFVGWQDLTPNELQAKIRAETDGLQKVVEWLNKGMDVLAIPSKYSEIATRATEYIKSRKSGKPQIVSIEEAGRVTAPFHHIGRFGGGNLGRVYIKSIPFFNPGIQVLAQAAEAINDPKGRARYAFVTLAITAALLASFGLMMKTATEEQKQLFTDLEPNEFAGYLWLPNPDGKSLIKIRIPQEIGAFGSFINFVLADQLLNANYSAGEYLDAATAFLPQQFDIANPAKALMAWIPQIIKPGVLTLLGVKDFPTIRPMESQAQMAKQPGMRFTESTSPVAKKLGEALNISPIKIDYLLTGYAGRATGFLTGKPGVYNPFKSLSRDYYFQSGRRVQNFYDTKATNDQQYHDYKNGITTFTDKQVNEIYDKRSILKGIDSMLKEYRDMDIVKEADAAAKLRTEILNEMEKL